jgi:hypothetical protein
MDDMKNQRARYSFFLIAGVLSVLFFFYKEKSDFKIFPIEAFVQYNIGAVENDTLGITKNFILEGRVDLKDSVLIAEKILKYIDSTQTSDLQKYKEVAFIFYPSSPTLTRDFKETKDDGLGSHDRIFHTVYTNGTIFSSVFIDKKTLIPPFKIYKDN